MALKSYAYDNVNYISTDEDTFNVAAGASSLSQKFVTFTQKQIKSVTLAPTTAGTSNDVSTLVQLTTLPVVFVGTSGTASAAASVAGTNTNTVTITNLSTFGSGATLPQNIPLSGGGPFTITVTAGVGGGTTTATAVTLPSGPTGGLAMASLDQIWVKHGTDATVAYSGALEYQYTPGSSFTI
jgi:hypothetical protein